VFIPGIAKAVKDKTEIIKAYVVGNDMKEINLTLGALTDAERDIILAGCLINYYRQ
jgi:aconitate hydratase